jgi:hypothetical protein
MLAAIMISGSVAPATEAGGPTYPERPVRVFVGLAPGGGTDSVARVMTQKLSEVFGQSFVVDNRPSAGGHVAGELAARAAPDGYTLITVTPTHVTNPSLYRDVRYDAIKGPDTAGLNMTPASVPRNVISVAVQQPVGFGVMDGWCERIGSRSWLSSSRQAVMGYLLAQNCHSDALHRYTLIA